MVPNNVWINLEVAADTAVPDRADFDVQDGEPNYRFNGSRTDIVRYNASREGHDDVHMAGSNSIDWVIDQIIAGLGRLGG